MTIGDVEVNSAEDCADVCTQKLEHYSGTQDVAVLMAHSYAYIEGGEWRATCDCIAVSNSSSVPFTKVPYVPANVVSVSLCPWLSSTVGGYYTTAFPWKGTGTPYAIFDQPWQASINPWNEWFGSSDTCLHNGNIALYFQDYYGYIEAIPLAVPSNQLVIANSFYALAWNTSAPSCQANASARYIDELRLATIEKNAAGQWQRSYRNVELSNRVDDADGYLSRLDVIVADVDSSA